MIVGTMSASSDMQIAVLLLVGLLGAHNSYMQIAWSMLVGLLAKNAI